MKFLKIPLLLFSIILIAFSGCKKVDSYDPEGQLAIDEALIVKYLAKNDLTAQRHETGLYYIIEDGEVGTGSETYTAATSVKVTYTLSLLGGNTIPQPTEPYTTALGNVIAGWQIGIPLIQEGGKIRLFVPSGYAYGPQSQNGIPANSILDFTINLLEVTNN